MNQVFVEQLTHHYKLNHEIGEELCFSCDND